MWLELDGDENIIGIHSHKCTNDHEWVEATGIDADIMPGDQWKNGKVVRLATKPTKSQKREVEINERRHIARQVITQYYQEWEQLNILREGDTEKMTSMGNFIDAVRAWSNAPNTPRDKLGKIIEAYFPSSK